MLQHYCASLTEYIRLRTREVKVGNLAIGGPQPIRIQTMTTTDTMNTAATVAQSIRCIEAGAELVRITAPSKNEAENLLNIKKELRARGYDTPLVADIHFTPNAAEIAARIVEKVRINPGNYIDKKKFDIIEYTDAEYAAEVARIRERFTPLLRICKEYGTAMRIGTNHGSLSDRIMSRYGDTPIGMVESAMEFLRIARDESYHQVILSMKSSNPLVMVQAYRLLVQKMDEEFGECYPLHLGVTEAGDGEDGRIKSAIGIGTLLEDGIGDTIRVSLTEDPEFEIPICKDIVSRYTNRTDINLFHGKRRPGVKMNNLSAGNLPSVLSYNPFAYRRRQINPVHNIGGDNVPVVISHIGVTSENIDDHVLSLVGYVYDAASDKWNINDTAADYIYTGDRIPEVALPSTLGVICDYNVWLDVADKKQYYPLINVRDYVLDEFVVPGGMHFMHMLAEDGDLELALDKVKNDPNLVLIGGSRYMDCMQPTRSFCAKLIQYGVQCPVIINAETLSETIDGRLINYAIDAGGPLLDGFGDGIWLTNDGQQLETKYIQYRAYVEVNSQEQFLNNTAFSILQATRTRISKTEYISCPSCGRTLFDLQETTAKIRAATNHLKGVKIAIMGCIVNGPGEMADADFGYVGSGPGKISLYKGKDVVKKNVPANIAVDELIQLLKENEAWVETPNL